MGLIVGAFVIAVWYMAICGRNARLVNEQHSAKGEGR